MNYAEGCRILYFDTGAGNNALLESASYPTNAFRGLEPKDATHVNLYFESAKGCNAVDTVELEIVSGTHTDVIVSITNVIANEQHPIDGVTDFQTSIFDGTSGFKINNNIVGCTIIQGTPCAGGGSGTTYQGGDGIEIDTSTSPDTIKTDLKANGGIVIQSGELAVDLSASSITGTLPVSKGGTGSTSGVTTSFHTSGGTTGSKSTANASYLIPCRDGEAFFVTTNPSSITFANATTNGISFGITTKATKITEYSGGVVTASTPSSDCENHVQLILLMDTWSDGDTVISLSPTVVANIPITNANQLKTFSGTLSASLAANTIYTWAFRLNCARMETWSTTQGWANYTCES